MLDQNSNSNSKVVLMVDSFGLKEDITQAVNEAMKSQEPEPEVYITHKEAEKRLGVCRATLWNWHNTGYLRKYYRCSLSAEQQRVVQAIRLQMVEVLKDKLINSNRMRDIVNFFRYRPGTFRLWLTSATAKLFALPKFENKKDSLGYFF